MSESNTIVSTLKTHVSAAKSQPLWKKIVAMIVILILGFFIYRQLQPSQPTSSQYQTTTVEQKSLVSALSVTGNIAMGSQFGVSSSVTGVVQDVYVKNGDQVSEGQKLFKVKSTASAQEKAAAYASYLNAKNGLQTAQQNKSSLDVSMWSKQQAVLNAQNNVNNMESNLDDYTDLERDAVYSARVQAQKDYALAEEKYKTSDSAVTSAQASLTSSLLAYQETQDSTITAPTTGVVANLAIQKGDAVTASNNSTTTNGTTSSTSTTAMYVTNFKDVVLKASVNEVDLPKVKDGQKATITIDAFPDQTFVGTVSRIDMIGTNSSNVVTFNVYISLLSPPENIGSGMTASGMIQLDSRDSAISLPSSAITTENNVSTVRVLVHDNQVEQRTVTTGLVTDTETEITSGLEVGEIVITGTSTRGVGSTGTATGTSAFSSSGGGMRMMTTGAGPRN